MIATLLGLVASATGALPGMSIVSAVISFLRTPLGRGVLIFAGLTVLAGVAYHKGEAKAEARCDAAALRAKLQATEIDLSIVRDRAAVQGDILQKLGASDAMDSETLTRVAAAIAAAKLQSTQPGAKKDAQSLLDDQCRLTRRGAGRL